MSCGDVGSSIGENSQHPQSKLNANETQPNNSESSDGMSRWLEPGGPEGHANGQEGQHRIDPVEHVHVDLKSCDGVNAFSSARVSDQRLRIRLGPPLAIGQRKIRDGQTGMLMAHPKAQDQLTEHQGRPQEYPMGTPEFAGVAGPP
jgi:hypothetical protein